MDETGFAPTTHRSHGWSEKGKRVYGEIHSDKRPRTSLIGGYLNRLLIAPFVFEGTCNTKVFNQWLKECLLPELNPQSVIIMDNAAFHKSQETRTLITKAECLLLFLPPYSPHLNPIEKLWANIKRAWSYHAHEPIDNIIAQYG